MLAWNQVVQFRIWVDGCQEICFHFKDPLARIKSRKQTKWQKRDFTPNSYQVSASNRPDRKYVDTKEVMNLETKHKQKEAATSLH